MHDGKKQQTKINKVEIFTLVLSTLRNISGTYRVDLSNRIVKGYSPLAFSFFFFIFHGADPIHYVQAATLNLPHPYFRSSTIFLDMQSVAIVFGPYARGPWEMGGGQFGIISKCITCNCIQCSIFGATNCHCLSTN